MVGCPGLTSMTGRVLAWALSVAERRIGQSRLRMPLLGLTAVKRLPGQDERAPRFYSAAALSAVFLLGGFFPTAFFAGSPAFRPNPALLAKEDRWAE